MFSGFANKFLTTDTKERHLRKNLVLTLGYQVATNVLSFVSVPLILGYLDKEKYGIWVSASVMIAWLQNLNLGLGSGLQNKVAEAEATNDKSLAKAYVSIVYQLSFYICCAIFLVFMPVIFLVNWQSVFNTKINQTVLTYTVLINFLAFIVFFIFGNINNILAAYKRTALTKLFGLASSVLTILFFLFIINLSNNDLVHASIALALPTPLIYIIATLYFFRKDFKLISPNLKKYSRELSRPLFSLSGKFFITQICSILIFQVGPIMIIQLYNPAEVTNFNVIGRYFFLAQFIFNSGVATYTSAYTEAYVKKEHGWIDKTIRTHFKLGSLAALGVLIMFFIGFWFIPKWSSGQVQINDTNIILAILFVPYTVINFFIAIITAVLNGLGKLKLQMYLYIAAAILNIPLILFLNKLLDVGISSVILAPIILLVIIFVVSLRQVKSILHAAA